MRFIQDTPFCPKGEFHQKIREFGNENLLGFHKPPDLSFGIKVSFLHIKELDKIELENPFKSLKFHIALNCFTQMGLISENKTL